MRISHSSLEACRSNPRRWVQANLGPNAPQKRVGYERVAKLAVFRFHRSRDAADARAYLLRTCRSYGLTNDRRIVAAAETLDDYIEWFQRSSPLVAEVKVNVELPLGHELVLGGEVSRIDILPQGGYRAVLLEEPPPRWREQLRMPLLQRAVARRSRRDETEVSMAVQSLVSHDIQATHFSPQQLAAATDEARRVAAIIFAATR